MLAALHTPLRCYKDDDDDQMLAVIVQEWNTVVFGFVFVLQSQ